MSDSDDEVLVVELDRQSPNVPSPAVVFARQYAQNRGIQKMDYRKVVAQRALNRRGFDNLLDLIIYQLHHEEFKHIEKQRQQILQEHARQTYDDIMNTCPAIGNNTQMDIVWTKSSSSDRNCDENAAPVTKLQVRQVSDRSIAGILSDDENEGDDICVDGSEKKPRYAHRDVLNQVPEIVGNDATEEAQAYLSATDGIHRKMFMVKSALDVVMDNICPVNTVTPEFMMSS